MKRIIVWLLAVVAACALIGCAPVQNEAVDSGTEQQEEIPVILVDEQRTSEIEGYFKLTIGTDKDTYQQGENIVCCATLTYIGDEDSITLTGNPPVVFDVYNEKYYGTSQAQADEEVTFKKGEAVRYDLTAVQWEDADYDKANKDEYGDQQGLQLLPGEYEIDVSVAATLPDGEKYEQDNVWANIKVTE